MNCTLRAALSSLLALPLCLSSQVGSAMMVERSLADLSTSADTIVVGPVVAQRSRWNPERTAIYTDVTVAVERVLAGKPGKRVTFRVAGGAVGDIGMSTSNDPEFETGERVVAFLDSSTTPARVLGRSQGAVRVRHGTVQRRGRSVSLAEFLDELAAERQR